MLQEDIHKNQNDGSIKFEKSITYVEEEVKRSNSNTIQHMFSSQILEEERDVTVEGEIHNLQDVGDFNVIRPSLVTRPD